MTTHTLPKALAPTSVGDFSKNFATWAIGALAATITALLVFIIMKAGNANQSISLAVMPLVWILVFLAGFIDGVIKEKFNSIALVLGKPIKLALPEGLIWWPPSWLGFGRRPLVTATTQQINIKVGDVATSKGVVYAKDRTPVEFDFELVGKVFDLWQWDIEYEKDPTGILMTVLDRTARWFANHFPATELVGMQSIMSQAIVGEIEKITINGEEQPLPDFGQKRIMADITKTGFDPARLYVQKVNVSDRVTRGWEMSAVEEGERDGERIQNKTVIELMQEMKEAFPKLSDQEILSAVQAERGKRDIVEVPGNAGDFAKGAAVRTSSKRGS